MPNKIINTNQCWYKSMLLNWELLLCRSDIMIKWCLQRVGVSQSASCVNSKRLIKVSSAAGSRLTFHFIVSRIIFDYVSLRGDRFDCLCCETLLWRCSNRKYIYVNSNDKTQRDIVSALSLTQGDLSYTAFMPSSDVATLHLL